MSIPVNFVTDTVYVELTPSSFLQIVCSLLDASASISDRWDAVQPLLEQLPDYGDKVGLYMKDLEPRLEGNNGYETDQTINKIFAAYELERTV